MIDPPGALSFIEADLKKCFFLNTNLEKVSFFGIDWPEIKGRLAVYDEQKLDEEEKVEKERSKERSIVLVHLERLYRQLKKHYEDNRDYERAGHFHYGEKEMRRKNPETSFGLSFLLTLYLWFSGYGERLVRPLISTGVLLTTSTFAYLCLGLSPACGKQSLSWMNSSDWMTASLYSLQVIFLLRPDDLVLSGLWAKALHTLQSILGPLFIALLALAVRQKLKR